MKTLPERMIHTTRLHQADIANEDGELVLYRGHLIPPTLKLGLKENRAEILRLLSSDFNGRA